MVVEEKAEYIVKRIVNTNVVVVFILSDSESHLGELFEINEIKYYRFDIDEHNLYDSIKGFLQRSTGQRKPPYIYIHGSFVGDETTVFTLYHNGRLEDIMSHKETKKKYDYDVIVLGGSFEGLTVATEAANMGKKVGLFDNELLADSNPTTGFSNAVTVNGTIPKHLMYEASNMRYILEDRKYFGWEMEIKKENQTGNWEDLMNNIIHYLNENNNIRTSPNLKLLSALDIKFLDKHTIAVKLSEKKTKHMTAQVFVLATGGQQIRPNFKGSELALTVNQLIFLKKKPSKALVVGAGPVAMEYAGILRSFDIDVTVMVRTKVLKKFDSQIAEMIVSQMKDINIKVLVLPDNYELISRGTGAGETCQNRNCIARMARIAHQNKNPLNEFPNLNYLLKLQHQEANDLVYGNEMLFDVVLLAAGREYRIKELDVEKLGVRVKKKTGKVYVNEYDRTHCSTIFAIGDVACQRPELVSVGAKVAKLLAKRMLGFTEVINLNDVIPMVVLTPLEYGLCGLSEDNAKVLYNEKLLQIYENRIYPLMWALQRRNHNRCYVKLICLKNENDKIIGVHVLGPYAGEIIQGFALAMKKNACKKDLDSFLGIQTTCGEALFAMTKVSPQKMLVTTGNYMASMQNN